MLKENAECEAMDCHFKRKYFDLCLCHAHIKEETRITDLLGKISRFK